MCLFSKYSHEEYQSRRWDRPAAALSSLESMMALETNRSAWFYRWLGLEDRVHRIFSRNLILWSLGSDSNWKRPWTPLLSAGACFSWGHPFVQVSCPGLAWRSRCQSRTVHGACKPENLQSHSNITRLYAPSSFHCKQRQFAHFEPSHPVASLSSSALGCQYFLTSAP